MKTTNPELEKALRIVRRNCPSPWSDLDRTEWNWAEAVLIKNKLCPACACDGGEGRLGKWRQGNFENYAGRYCTTCEAFWKCGEQFVYPPYEYDTDANGQCYSDCDPSL